MVKRIQYPQIVRPLFWPNAFKETVTEDRWHQPFSTPPSPKPALIAAQNPAFFADPHVAPPYPETVTIDRWLQPFSTPVRVAYRSPDFPQPFYVGNPVVSFSWFEPLSEPVRTAPRPPDLTQNIIAPTQAAPISIGWFQPFSTPPSPKLGVHPSQTPFFFADPHLAAPYPETTTVDRWFEQWREPVRTAARAPDLPQPAFVTVVSAVNFGWFQPWTDPIRTLPRPVQQQRVGFGLPVSAVETITVDKWFQPFSEPVRVPPRAPDFSSYFADPKIAAPYPESVHLNWFQPFSEPVRKPPPAPIKQRTGFLGTPTTVVVSIGWFQPFSEPVRVPPRAPDLPEPVRPIPGTWAETVTVDRWWQPWREPVRSRPGLLPALQVAYVAPLAPIVPPTVTMSWFAAFSEPVRAKVLPPGRQRAGGLGVPETVTVDRWLIPFSEPVRVPPRAPDFTGFFGTPFTAPETVTESRWHQPFSEPVRVKQGLAISEHPSFFAPTKVVVSFSWYVPFREPVRARAPAPVSGEPILVPVQPTPPINFGWFEQFSEPVRQKPRAPDFPSIFQSESARFPEVVHNNWWQPFSEPVRQRPRLIEAAQPFFFMNPVYPVPAFNITRFVNINASEGHDSFFGGVTAFNAPVSATVGLHQDRPLTAS